MTDSLVVVPSYMRGDAEYDVTCTTLETLRDHEPDVDVLVVDDCSPDTELVRMLSEWAKELGMDIMCKTENEGFSRTVNHGLRRCLLTGQHAILCNADMEFVRPFVQELAATTDSQDRPAAVAGALLLYPSGQIQHAGVFFCQPPDSTVLTVQHGYVPISELDPAEHGLVSWSAASGKIHRVTSRTGRWTDEWRPQQEGGYPFKIGSRPYRGEMLSVSTRAGTVRVTPNHKMTIGWTERALSGYGVYLMRRGNDWRIGHVKMRHGGASRYGAGSFGPRMRFVGEQADAVWLLRTCETKSEAVHWEALLSWRHRVPTWSFIIHGAGTKGVTTQEGLNYLWDQVDSAAGGLEALSSYGRSPDWPLLQRENEVGARRRHPVGVSRRYPIHAANLMPECMVVRTDPGYGSDPELSEFYVDIDSFSGDVYSMEVHPYHHYVSDGVVVANSFLNRAFDHRYRYGPGGLPEAQLRFVCPVTGALQFIRNDTIKIVGLYDEDFRMGFEDVDFCLRAFDAGLECVYNPRVIAIHHESIFRGQRTERLDEWQQASLDFLHSKHAKTPLGRFVPPIT